MKNLKDETVTISGDHTIFGTKLVTGSVEAQSVTVSTINGFNFPDDFVTITGNETITTKVFIDDLLINGDIIMEDLKTINDVDISEIQKNTVTLTGNHTILTPVEFNKITITNNLNTIDHKFS